MKYKINRKKNILSIKFNFYNYSVCFTMEYCNKIIALNLKHQSNYIKLNKNVLYIYIYLHNIFA